jgi:hypothetical protein
MAHETGTRRSIFRPRNLFLAIVAGLLIWVGVTFVSVMNQKPGVPGKFTATINQMVAEAQAGTAGETNGWPLVIEAAAVYDRVAKPLAERPLPDGVPESIKPPLSAEMVTIPEANEVVRREVAAMLAAFEREGLFEKLDEAAASRRFVRELPQGKLIEVMIPEVGSMRGIARLCRARMFFAAEAKDAAAFVRAARHGLALGDVAAKQATFIDRLVGAAIDQLVLQGIREAIRDHGLDEATCRSLMDLLKDRRGFDAVQGLRIEHLSAQDTVEWTHSDDGKGNGRLMPSQSMQIPGVGNLPTALRNFGGLAEPSKRKTLDAFEDLYSVAEQQAKLGLRSRDPQANSTALAKYSRRNKMVDILLPALDRFLTLSDQHDLALAATRLMLALELHKHAKGEHPERLSDLDPALDAVALTTPWAEELRYRRFAPGEDPEKRPYLLYWIGLDGADDHGRLEPLNGSQGAWMPKRTGVDFVFNEPKEKPKADRSEETGK